mmetsp:Transcript_6671/g.12654  ORF Transcript_6671/g.12654 Transcript_6671/m.12654 type:complete len:372 (+) Transcript_6671:1375-2490(+)
MHFGLEGLNLFLVSLSTLSQVSVLLLQRPHLPSQGIRLLLMLGHELLDGAVQLRGVCWQIVEVNVFEASSRARRLPRIRRATAPGVSGAAAGLGPTLLHHVHELLPLRGNLFGLHRQLLLHLLNARVPLRQVLQVGRDLALVVLHLLLHGLALLHRRLARLVRRVLQALGRRRADAELVGGQQQLPAVLPPLLLHLSLHTGNCHLALFRRRSRREERGGEFVNLPARVRQLLPQLVHLGLQPSNARHCSVRLTSVLGEPILEEKRSLVRELCCLLSDLVQPGGHGTVHHKRLLNVRDELLLLGRESVDSMSHVRQPLLQLADAAPHRGGFGDLVQLPLEQIQLGVLLHLEALLGFVFVFLRHKVLAWLLNA